MSPNQRVVLAILTLGSAASVLCGQTRVEIIATAMHHVSVIQVPDPVENVALGSQLVHVEWTAMNNPCPVAPKCTNILIEPLRAAIKTNLVVFTHRATYLYEITEASDPATLSYFVQEAAAAPPPVPVKPSADEIQKDRDTVSTAVLLKSHLVDRSGMKPKKHSVIVLVLQVSEDSNNYFVHLAVTNTSSHVYRLQDPTVAKIDPMIGGGVAYKEIDHQLTAQEFKAFRRYQELPVGTHYSTLKIIDMPPETTTEWVLAITKPEVTPAIFRFTFQPDQGAEVNAAAIF